MDIALMRIQSFPVDFSGKGWILLVCPGIIASMVLLAHCTGNREPGYAGFFVSGDSLTGTS